MGNEIDLGRRRLVDLPQHLPPALGHHHQAGRRAINSCITRRCSAFGSRKNGVQRGDDGHVQFAQQRQQWLPAGPPKMPNSCCTQTTSTLLMFRKSAARRYDGKILLCDLEAHHVRIFVAALDVIDRHRKAFESREYSAATALRRSVRERGDAAFARQVIAEKSDRSDLLREFPRLVYAALLTVSLTSSVCCPSRSAVSWH